LAQQKHYYPFSEKRLLPEVLLPYLFTILDLRCKIPEPSASLRRRAVAGNSFYRKYPTFATMNNRELFLKHIAQTSSSPIGLEIIKAEGTVLYDASGKKYLDLIGGISVCNTGHRHSKVVEAIKKQVDEYLHILVYGEFIQYPQVQYATLLTQHLPSSLNSVYFTNSGAEAVEGAMKLAKRVTGRTQIIAFKHSYHGSTQGALSIMGDEYWRNAFRPLLPDILHLDHNSVESLENITGKTACVITETVQAEKGVYTSTLDWMKALSKKCSETGALLILDEIQTGFGRTGTLWGFEQFNIVPDILLLGKALGGGMPLGAFITDKKLMWSLTADPVLGHITTFGGHPVSCAAGLASLKVLLEENLINDVNKKEELFRSLLIHPKIRSVRSAGLLIAVEFDNFEINKKIIDKCIEHGVLTDWFLFAPHCMRIAPPLIINEDEIQNACKIILAAIDQPRSPGG
jgi:acetylornithine/N-succinyldiaminopimelate aminotransferase